MPLGNPNTISLEADRRFLLTHVLLPALAIIMLALLAENSWLDLQVANLWYQLQGGHWAWRDHWLAYELIHHHGKQGLIAFGLVIISLFTLSFKLEALYPWRRSLGYLLLCMILLPATIAEMKALSPVPCPWDIIPFGGETAYQHTSSYTFGPTESGNCFPSGHASGGFALLAVYFAAVGHSERRAIWLIPGLLVGWVFALGQQARGAHFLSHDLFTMAYSWFGALLLFLLIRPDRTATLLSAEIVDERPSGANLK